MRITTVFCSVTTSLQIPKKNVAHLISMNRFRDINLLKYNLFFFQFSELFRRF